MSDYQNNYQNRVSTTGITLFDKDSTMMRMSYLDDTFSLTITKPDIDDNGKKTYPDKNKNPFLITAERGASLYFNVICDGLVKAMDMKQNYTEGVFLNRQKTSIFQIEYDAEKDSICGVYCKNINDQRVSESTVSFHFQKTDLIKGYHPESGEFADQGEAHGSFMLFSKYLEKGIDGMTGGNTHGWRKGTTYTTKNVFEYLRGIAAKLGVVVNTNNYQPQNSPSSGFMQIPDAAGEELPFTDDPMMNASGSMDDLVA